MKNIAYIIMSFTHVRTGVESKAALLCFPIVIHLEQFCLILSLKFSLVAKLNERPTLPVKHAAIVGIGKLGQLIFNL